MIRKKILCLYADNFGCGNYRIKIPYNHFKSVYEKDFDVTIKDFQQFIIQSDRVELLNYDYYIIQRAMTEPTYEFIKFLKDNKKIIIHELDDDIKSVKQHNPAYKYIKETNALFIHNKSIKIFDYHHVTCEHLKTQIAKVNNKLDSIKVFPNAIDLSDLSYKNNYRNNLPKDKIIIGYQGSSSHSKDIEEIIEPMNFICNKYKNVIFAFCCNPEFIEKFSIPLEQIKLIPPIDNFQQFKPIPSFFDIGLVPLNDRDELNYSKSYLKALEFGIYDIPIIASNVGEYARLNHLGIITTVKNKTKKWIELIEILINNKQLRSNLGSIIKENMFNNRDISLDGINQKRYDFFKGLG